MHKRRARQNDGLLSQVDPENVQPPDIYGPWVNLKGEEKREGKNLRIIEFLCIAISALITNLKKKVLKNADGKNTQF